MLVRGHSTKRGDEQAAGRDLVQLPVRRQQHVEVRWEQHGQRVGA